MIQSPLQIIIFGSPGTGKSYYANETILREELDIDPDGPNCISTVFHPEYSYGDFIGKLLPLTAGDKVVYRYYAGHFLRALSIAYKNILQENEQKVALVIDEINRGNSSAIFGTVFQLLDRDKTGWSNYEVNVSDMEFDTIMRGMGIDVLQNQNSPHTLYNFNGKTYSRESIKEIIAKVKLNNNHIKLPPNLSIVATMNTSDNSIYYMDTAFKRRWEWQYIDINSIVVKSEDIAFANRDDWKVFVYKLNKFIQKNARTIRNADDKLIGHWFITGKEIKKSQIQNKVMFYLWDSVFSSNKKPLVDLITSEDADVVVFSEFMKNVDGFIDGIAKQE